MKADYGQIVDFVTSADVVEVVNVKRGVTLGPVVPGVELEQGHLLLQRGTLHNIRDRILGIRFDRIQISNPTELIRKQEERALPLPEG